MQARKLTLYPNPYHALDAVGRLAGAYPEGESMRDGATMPRRVTIGAVRKVLEHRPPGSYTQQSRTVSMFVWSGEPVTVEIGADLDAFYASAFRSGGVFEVVAPGVVRVPGAPAGKDTQPLLAALAAARLAAIDARVAEIGREPCMDSWAEQFPRDAEVAAAMAALAAARDAAAAERAAEPAPAAPPAAEPYSLSPPSAAPAPAPDAAPAHAQGRKPKP